mmetsp:Transcript_4553/g.14773  ORF Transcript_4553/g.14773 Transcript_4553/m.14773 type:complete len:229 (-) Transcript_4553:91-777(-)
MAAAAVPNPPTDGLRFGGYATAPMTSPGVFAKQRPQQPQQQQQRQVRPPEADFNLDELYRGEPYIAHEMPQYGPRTTYWVEVRGPEQNHGIVINGEFPGEMPTGPDGRPEVLYFYDQAIRNEGWHRIGQRMPRLTRPGVESVSSWLHHHADYSNAVDMKGELMMENAHKPRRERIGQDYHYQHACRKPDGVEQAAAKVREHLGREILDRQQIEEFFGDPRAVALDTLQ